MQINASSLFETTTRLFLTGHLHRWREPRWVPDESFMERDQKDRIKESERKKIFLL